MTRRVLARQPDRPTFPSVRKDIGEDPARFLYDGGMDPWPRLTGIDDREVAGAWLGVARALDCDEGVQEYLERRVDELSQPPGGDRAAEGGASA